MNLRRFCVLAFLIIAVLASGSIAQGQGRRCKVSSIAFACPVGLKLVHRDAVLELFSRKDVVVFVTPAEGDVALQLLASDIVKSALPALFPKNSQEFAWKNLEPSKPLSKFETYRAGQQGFNGSTAVAVDYRIIHTRSTDVMVGYVASLGSGDEVKKIFERNLPADTLATIAGCEASVKLIYSITHEKWEKDNSPCSLDVRSASASPVTFGTFVTSQTQSLD